MGFNKIILEGRLAKEIELKYSASGVAMAKSTIAVSKKFTSNGETKEKTLFVTIQFWKRSAEIFSQFCRKGSRILIEGELENNDYIDAQGVKKYGYLVNVSSMQMLDSKSDNTEPQSNVQAQKHTDYQPKQQAPRSMPNTFPEIDINEDEIPF